MTAQGIIQTFINDPRWASDIRMWQRRTDSQLAKEYLEMSKAMFGPFKGNAKTWRNIVAAMLLDRGVTHIDNIFAPIEIKIV